READLLVGTHGRSIFKIDLEHVRAVAGDVADQSLFVFDIDVPRFQEGWGTRRASYVDYRVPSAEIVVYSASAGEAQLALSDEDGRSLKDWKTQLDAGLNYLDYDLTVDTEKLRSRRKNNPYADWGPSDDGQTYLREGTYQITVTLGSDSASSEIELKSGR
ncbi:MAG: hypothetical protein HKN13_01350, partial [Rhodothermales bacterium]|nr:hypothetical protein [Rhodothermales bacterium]